MRWLGVLLLCASAAGCTDADYEHALGYVGLEDAGPPPPARPAAPVVDAGGAPGRAADPSHAEFCRAAARSDADARNFDQATQARMAAASYAQCLWFFSK